MKNKRQFFLILAVALPLALMLMAADSFWGSKTVVATMHGETNYFNVTLGNHASSPYRKISASNLVSVINTINLPRTNLGTTRFGGAVLFDGTTADANEVTLTSEDATADSTITLPRLATGDVPITVHRNSAITGVTNSTTETTFVQYTIPGGMLSTNKTLEVEVCGLWSASGTQTNRMRVYLGDTTIWDGFAFKAVSVSTNNWRLWFSLTAQNSQAAQSLSIAGVVGGNAPGTGSLVGRGGLAQTTANLSYSAGNETAIGTDTNLVFKVTFAPEQSAAGYWFNRQRLTITLR